MDIIVNNAIAQIEAISFSSIWMELFLIVLKTVLIILGFALVSGAGDTSLGE